MLKEAIIEILEDRLNEEDLYLVELKVLPTQRIHVFVDGDNGVSIDQCAKLSRYLENTLEERSLVPDKYVLEVSSPGIDRPLIMLRQYTKNLGRTLDVIDQEGKKISGVLKSADEAQIELEVPLTKKEKQALRKENIKQDNKSLCIPMEDIKKATIQIKI